MTLSGPGGDGDEADQERQRKLVHLSAPQE